MKVYKGKRGMVYGILNLAIKVERKDSGAINRIKNEAKWLKILNQYKIGPKIYFSWDNFIVFEFVKGKRILDYFEGTSEKDKLSIVKEVLRQCRALDKLHVNKFEMHHPIKHILIKKNKKIVMIDFERCKYSLYPKNVTQFVQFLPWLGFKIDKEKIMNVLRSYKKDYSEESYKKILNLIK